MQIVFYLDSEETSNERRDTETETVINVSDSNIAAVSSADLGATTLYPIQTNGKPWGRLHLIFR